MKLTFLVVLQQCTSKAERAQPAPVERLQLSTQIPSNSGNTPTMNRATTLHAPPNTTFPTYSGALTIDHYGTSATPPATPNMESYQASHNSLHTARYSISTYSTLEFALMPGVHMVDYCSPLYTCTPPTYHITTMANPPISAYSSLAGALGDT